MRFLLALTLLCASLAHAETVRLAVVVGNNAGAGTMPPLRYAETDAGKFARVLLELGDVAPDRLQLLQGKSAKELEGALGKLRAQADAIKSAPENRVVVLFYFSGHSDGESLELGSEVLPFTRLKSILSGIGDVRVVVVDACRSGAGFREKGGKQADPFTIKLTDTLQSTGDAFIASSAENEAALESAEVLGSIFTHHFVSGLRGVADLSGDKQVTLAEAYRYAYDQTVSRTTLMPVGAQHPTYDYKLSGQGELVMSTLQRATAQLVLPLGFERAVVSDVLRDQVIAEVPTGATREVAVPAGQYGLRVYKQGQSFGGRIAIAEGGRREVKWDELSAISSSVNVASKGGALTATQVMDSVDWASERVLGVSAGVVPSIGGIGAQLAGRLGFEPRLGPGLSFAVAVAYASRGIVSETGLEARAGWRYSWRFGPVWLGVGAEVGPALVLQQTGTTAGLLTSVAGVVAPRFGLRFLVGGPFVVVLEGEAGVALYGTGSGVGVAFRPSGTGGFGFKF
ncbi:MAG: caspase family protein [Archangium sp.]